MTGYQVTTSTVKFAAGFVGGGQHVFNNCTFTGTTAFIVPATASTDGLAFFGSNWESCTTVGLYIGGTVNGLSFFGCRTEAGGGIDFNFRPFGAAEYVAGLAVHGCTFSASNSSGVTRISMGGDSGIVRGFSISGNSVTHSTDSYAANFVTLNGDGESGEITGNFIRGTTGSGAGVVNTARAGVVVRGNENLTGKLPEILRSTGTAVDADTTPSVLTLGRLVLSNSGATSITTFDDAHAGQEVELYATNGNTTLINGATLALKGAANQLLANSNIVVIVRDPTNAAWVEKSRNF